MKLSLIGSSGCLALLVGCSGSTSPPVTAPNPDGGAPGAQGDDTSGPPHALGMITLAETHLSGGSSATPFVAAAFVPDATQMVSCTLPMAGCRVPMQPLCDGRNGPLCGSSEVCSLDTSCRAQCQKPCTLACTTGQECYFATPSSQACRAIESFDAGAIAFAGTTTPLTLYPPYSFAGDGNGAPFLAGASIEVQGSGATGAASTSSTRSSRPPRSCRRCRRCRRCRSRRCGAQDRSRWGGCQGATRSW